MLISAAVLLALALAEGSLPGRHPPPSTGFYFAPPVAADHEAVVLSNEGSGRPEQRRIIVRSGSWLRENGNANGRTGTVHSDFAEGISISYALDAAGNYTSLLIARHPSTDSFGRYRRARTGKHGRVLGENCEVWNTTRVGEQEEGIDHLSCDTVDGIQLWSRVVSQRTNYIISESRTLSFRRRPVSPEEVHPPDDLLNWPYWRNLSARDLVTSWPKSRPRNYDLRMKSVAGAGEVQRILRSRDDWSYQGSTARDGSRRLHIDNRVISIGYEAEADGRPVRLSIHRLPSDQVAVTDASGYIRNEPAEAEQVIGETCYWSQRQSGGDIVVISGDHRICVTADGLPLRILSHHRVLISNLTATRLVRRRPPRSAVMPPAEAFDWIRWGVTPAK